MLLRKFKMIKLSFIPFYFIYFSLVICTIYFLGTKKDFNKGYIFFITTSSLIPFISLPFAFFALHYFFYKDVNVKTKLISTFAILIFSIIFFASYYLDKTSEYLEERNLLIFIFGFILNSIIIFYTIDVFKK